MVHTSPSEDGRQKANGREDSKGTKAKARAKGTRASVGDADRSDTNKMSAQINISESSKSSQSSKVSQPRPWDQLRFQNNQTAW